MTTTELKTALHLEPLCEAGGVREITGWYAGDLLSWVMGRAESGNVWVTIMTNLNVVAVAQLTDVACVILAEGVEVEPAVLAKAEAQGINLYRSPMSTYELCHAQLFL